VSGIVKVDTVVTDCALLCSPAERSAEELEMIYDELLHIKALSHLSTMVKRELAGVLVFEAHWNAGKVCKHLFVLIFTNRY